MIKASVLEARKLQRDYLCSDCWGPLVPRFDKQGNYYLTCPTEGCPCRGAVTSAWVAREKMRRARLGAQARKDLAGLVDWLDKPEANEANSEEKILSELGFFKERR